MSEKASATLSTDIYNEGEELKVVVTELNQNVAYLSKMVMQLQRSLNAKKQAEAAPRAKPEQTLH